MTRVPALAAIDAAELRLLQSKRNVRQSVDRTRSALRAAIARPSTLMLVAVASGISVFLVSRQRCPSVKSPRDSADSATRAPRRGLVRAFISLYGAQVVAFALHHGAAAWKQRRPRVDSDTPVTSATDNPATTEHDSPGPD